MGRINVGQENSDSIELYYEDHGSGHPIILIHGFPLNGASWEKQTAALLAAGHRVITYDRRGFGRSSQPASGYDYDTFAEDLQQVVTQLDLKEFALVGFSMGGGELARYLGRFGSERVRAAVFISSVAPYLLKTSDNPEGVDRGVFEGIKQAIIADRPAFLTGFFENFYNADLLLGKRISSQVIQSNWNVAAAASPIGTLACVDTWGTNFLEDVRSIKIPTLVIHGDADRIVPIQVSGARVHQMVEGSRLEVIKDGPHGILWTHADEVGQHLVDFLG